MAQIKTYARSFAGGEVTPEFFGRVDDIKNQTGLRTCRNFDVLPHGPVANRNGTTFVKEVKDSTKEAKLLSFEYSDEQTLLIEMGHQYIRFHTMGATLLAGSPAAYDNLTAYTVGNVVSSGGVNYYCTASSTGNAPPNASYWYPMPADGTYEMPTPYDEADVFDIHFVQSEDVLTLTHPSYAPRELRRLGATYWILATIAFTSELVPPAGITATATVATGSDFITHSYTVTSVDSTGREESLQGTPDDCSNNLLTTGNKNTITWSSASGASRYNVYKQDNGLYGYLGQTDGLSFVDDNITPDISQTPPLTSDPFNGANNYPRAVSYYDQRRDFAGTTSLPQNIWMTRTGTESNLAYSIPTRDSDGISFKISAQKRNTIRHLVPLADLIALTSSGVWKVTSVNSDNITPTSIAVKKQSSVGASNTQPVVAGETILYEAARGGHVQKLVMNIAGTAWTAKDLSLRARHLFDFLRLRDMAFAEAPYPIMYATSSSGHLLGLSYVPDQEIEAWFWYDSYTNGGTFDAATGVTGGARSLFKSVAVVPEGDEDAVYAIVERVIDGQTVRYIERKGSRNFATIADAYFVDCGVTFDSPVTITDISQDDPGHVTAPGHGFSDGEDIDLSDIQGMTGLNGQRVYVDNATTDAFDIVDQYGNPVDTSGFEAYTGGGYARRVIRTISSGLDHLEGETVSILANGAVQPRKTVTGGSVTLDYPASIIHIGLPIEADIETLPLAVEAQAFGQGRQKNVNKGWLRVYRSSGVFMGPSFDELIENKPRTIEPFGSPPSLKSDELEMDLEPEWASTGSVCVRQSDPLPLTITGMTLEVSFGS